MKTGGGGGGTTRTGLAFEARTSLATAIAEVPGYEVKGSSVIRFGKEVGRLCPKAKLYDELLRPKNINPRTLVSKLLLPDEAVLSLRDLTVHILEKKFQQVSGSVDEKLQTCDFKLRQYRRLLAPLNLKVTYSYVLNDWFSKKEYEDTLAYVKHVGARYYFYEVPLADLGL